MQKKNHAFFPVNNSAAKQNTIRKMNAFCSSTQTPNKFQTAILPIWRSRQT